MPLHRPQVNNDKIINKVQTCKNWLFSWHDHWPQLQPVFAKYPYLSKPRVPNQACTTVELLGHEKGLH